MFILVSFYLPMYVRLLDKLCHLFESLAGHSIMPNDVKQLFSIMRPFEEGELVCGCMCA